MAETLSISGFPRAGFRRRVAVIVYDILVVVAIAFFANIVGLGIIQALISLNILDMGNEQDIAGYLQSTSLLHIAFQCYLAVAVSYFYIWFWSNGGQTVGMKAWRLRIQNESGHDISKKQAIVRLLTSVFGLGNLLVIFDRKHKLALQDRAAKCEVVLLTKEANQHKNWQKLY